MAISFVEHTGGRARVRWSGAAGLLSGLLSACALIPAAGFWFAFRNGQLVSTALMFGFMVACLSFGAIVGGHLRRPIEQLPTRTESDHRDM